MSIYDIVILLLFIAGIGICIHFVRSFKAKELTETETNAQSTSVDLYYLNREVLESPAFALENAIMEVGHMAETTYDSMKHAFETANQNEMNQAQLINENEMKIDQLQKLITEYLVDISNLSLAENQRFVLRNLFYMIHDLERAGDYAKSIAELVILKNKNTIIFSKEAQDEIDKFLELGLICMENGVQSIKEYNIESVRKVVKYKDMIDTMGEELREKHMERLSHRQCKADASIIFLDLISNVERISDHAYHIAGYIKDEIE